MKKTLSLFLALLMALTLVGCGGNNNSAPSANPIPSQEPTPSPEPTPTPEPSLEPENEFTTATIGETVTLEGADVELTTGKFASGDKLGGNISVSSHSESNKYFWLSGTMTNVGTETIASSWGIDSIVNIIFDDKYTYEGSLHVRNDMGPFGESEVLFWADVPPAMLERYQAVKVQFAYNDGFADYDWPGNNYEKKMDGYDHQYELVQGSEEASNGDAA